MERGSRLEVRLTVPSGESLLVALIHTIVRCFVPLILAHCNSETCSVLGPSNTASWVEDRAAPPRNFDQGHHVFILYNCDYTAGSLDVSATWINVAVPRSTVFSRCVRLTACLASQADPEPCRKLSTQKAWTQGTNPITQRSSTPGTANGAASAPKPTPSAKSQASTARETNTPEKHAHDRLTFLLANFMVSNGLLRARMLL